MVEPVAVVRKQCVANLNPHIPRTESASNLLVHTLSLVAPATAVDDGNAQVVRDRVVIGVVALEVEAHARRI